MIRHAWLGDFDQHLSKLIRENVPGAVCLNSSWLLPCSPGVSFSHLAGKNVNGILIILAFGYAGQCL